MFVNQNDVKNLRWNTGVRKCDELLRHPTYSVQWKNIDKEFLGL